MKNFHGRSITLNLWHYYLKARYALAICVFSNCLATSDDPYYIILIVGCKFFPVEKNCPIPKFIVIVIFIKVEKKKYNSKITSFFKNWNILFFFERVPNLVPETIFQKIYTILTIFSAIFRLTENQTFFCILHF